MRQLLLLLVYGKFSQTTLFELIRKSRCLRLISQQLMIMMMIDTHTHTFLRLAPCLSLVTVSQCHGGCAEVDSMTEAVAGESFFMGCISCKKREEVPAHASVDWHFRPTGENDFLHVSVGSVCTQGLIQYRTLHAEIHAEQTPPVSRIDVE